MPKTKVKRFSQESAHNRTNGRMDATKFKLSPSLMVDNYRMLYEIINTSNHVLSSKCNERRQIALPGMQFSHSIPVIKCDGNSSIDSPCMFQTFDP